MCFSYNFSVFSFISGILSCLSLKKYGNPKLQETNNILCYLFSFIICMQIIEALMWNDLKCKYNYNKLAGILGPLFNNFQPTILFICAKYYNRSNNIYIDFTNYLYIGYVLYTYIQYLYKNKLCSKLNKSNHLQWSWIHNKKSNKFSYSIYHIILILNFIFLFKNNYIEYLTPILIYLFFGISYYYFNENIGELWCLFVIAIPIILLLIQKISLIN